MKFRVVSIIVVTLLLILPLLTIFVSSGNSPPANQPPTAYFTYSPLYPMPDENIIFDASASHDPDGWIVQYRWNFGDGNTITVTNPVTTHTYLIDGNYTVELTVTDNSGSTSVSTAVIQVSTEIFFRVNYYGTLIPMSNVEVTMYYYDGVAWTKAPTGSSKLEIRYDRMTEPDLANTPEEKYRNPAFTANTLLSNASNVGFDVHPSSWYVYFKFQWGGFVTYWPNETTRVYTYKDGAVEAHDYSYDKRAEWSSTAGTYVIKAKNIPSCGVSPSMNHPIIVGALCPPPLKKYYLTVKTDPVGVTTIPGEGLYTEGTNATLTSPTFVYTSTDTRYRFNYWDVDGASQGIEVNPITVCMNANHTATAHYIRQYLMTFNQTGLSSDATGTVATIDGINKTYSELPFNTWADTGSTINYTYTSPVPSSISYKRYRLNNISGPSSPITITEPLAVTGNYVAQYLITFAQTGLNSNAIGTVLTVNGNPKTYGNLPYSFWADSGSSVTYSFSSTVSSSIPGQRFRLVAIHSPTSPFTVTGPESISGEYCQQWQVTIAQLGLDSTATGTVVTVNGSAKAYTNLPFIDWVDSGSTVTYTYSDPVLSTVSGKRFKLTSATGPASPLTVTSSVTVTGNYKIQYQVTFDQTGVGTDFTGTVLTVDSVNYGNTGLPVSFWWDKDSSHTFTFQSPLIVDSNKQYAWSSTSGPWPWRTGTITVTTSGNVVGNYVVANRITFDQLGAYPDFTGTVVIIDGTSYNVGTLPVFFMWEVGTTHNFAYQSPLVVSSNTKQYVWTSTTGLSTLQSGSITVATFGSIVGNYKTQYYLTLVTNPSGVASPSGEGWYDANAYASISTPATVDIVPGSSRYRFNGWTTPDMPEITNASATTTTVFMDKAKTTTANYLTQYAITFDKSGIGTDFDGAVVAIDGTNYTRLNLPTTFWWNSGSSHTFSFHSPLFVDNSKQYVWSSTSGLSTLQSKTLTITSAGSITGNYNTQTSYQITFGQTGASDDYEGTVVTIDGVDYKIIELPASFWWPANSVHTFAYQSPLTIAPDSKQYVWISTSGPWPTQTSSITITASATVVGNYKTQYYLTLATDPIGVASPSGEGWYDANTNATVSTSAFVDIVPGASRYRFNGWTTPDMPEIADPSRSPTEVLMDKAKTVTVYYVIQYAVSFNKTGVGPEFAGNIVAIDGLEHTVSTLPVSFWWDKDSSHDFAYHSPLVAIPNVKQYAWASTSGPWPWQGGTITVTTNGNVVGNYKTQYYLTVTSPYGSPTPESGWFDDGANVIASVTTPWSGPTNTRYVCTGWTGTGSVPPLGGGPPVSFTITQASSITWNWKTQYYLTVKTDPPGITTIPGEGWYDAPATATLTAPTVTNYQFSYWDVDGTSRGNGVNPIGVTMNAPHTATAHYTPQGQSYTLTIITTAGGTTNPVPGSYTYIANSTVQVSALPNLGYTFNHWELDSINVGSTNPYTVTMNMNHTLTAIFTAIPPPQISINPLNTTIPLGQSVGFTSTVTGGTTPYSYQWYLNSNPVSGATSGTWTFTPASSGTYFVYLKVTDANNNTVQSATAKVTVISIPVGGYSNSLISQTPLASLMLYTAIIALFGAALSLTRRKKK